MSKIYETESGKQREIKLVSESIYAANRAKQSSKDDVEKKESCMFENSFNYYMPKSTVDHLKKWGETTRIFEESVTGFGNISCAHVKECLAYTGTKVIDTDQSIKKVYSFSRTVTNEWNKGYPYFEKDGLAIVREYDGEYNLCIFDDAADLCKWVKPLMVLKGKLV